MSRNTPIEVRFWRKVQKGGPDDCWPWLGKVRLDGYGIFARSHTKQTYAHIVSWELENGPVPDGYEIHHACRVRDCVNPDHLQLVTPLEHARLEKGKTHCLRGHLLDDENTYTWAGRPSSRNCRECGRIRCRAAYHRRRHG